MDITEKERDARTVKKFKGGDLLAFEKLVSSYEGRIYRFLSKMCGCGENAKDVLQETFLNAYRYLNGFRGEASFKTWLYKIASTACLRNKRRRKDEPGYHLSFEDLLPGEAERKNIMGQGWYTTPINELLDDELKEHIEKSLQALPEKYRIVFVLREREGLSGEDVAEAVGISVAAVKSRLHRARLFLRKELSEYYLHEGKEKAVQGSSEKG